MQRGHEVNGVRPWGPEPMLFDEDVIELSFLLTGSQAAALEAAAHRHGLTAAQMVRRLIGDLTQRCGLMPADTPSLA